ncbi:2-(3-amino-3-carboxypropyl)histidine synthase subunit 2-like [Acanthaster planci]|uniref:2-(3-amino-3-carboxypropyl)histidine synthase subunit 2 n=1 Tax=Acanthaster planci TaxID=133434 RepID=A0A8B7ZA05_ACAPL|nr:2-(3-amino-3-carboxypropyl)histidine synthase subunit 2-like [Acanthaster planci]XP_022101646.1 2-(3-amino-3-carboxypropyl)histidine synthase subunit 2-like [Acanthaster planci]XP_022101647.1 2-(3-amino-3-carboxypropyl)histidine synthase subunit 2-like [Acanthaster planci]XP_022101648.1 2-(3-amino-3-carboxypropyl)histidine synthase subunit 2-like [Acanthaster planci]
MATAFSSDGSEIIQRSIEVSAIQASLEADLPSAYEIPRCVDFIRKNGYSKVALQFPDELLPDSSSIVKLLQQETSATVFILADTSYGSCCVDEIAAQHANADSIIHFGRACLSPTSRLPVLYVFGRRPIDEDHCCEIFQEFFGDSSKPVVVMYDVVYAHCVDSLARRLMEVLPVVVVSRIVDPAIDLGRNTLNLNNSRTSSGGDDDDGTDVDLALLSMSNTFCQFGRRFTIGCEHALEDYAVFYVGAQTTTLTNLMMTYNRCPFFTYDPEQRRSHRETLNVNRALMKRYYLIERARDANVVGIVAGTLGVRDYLTVINQLKTLLKKAGKKTYTFVVGKLNVAKLANFMEVDIYVLVSCPENSLIDSSEFYKPVVTPFEMEIACNRAREWTGEYVTDFRQILPGAAKHVELPSSDSEEREVPTDISLVTGKLRSLGRTEEASDVTASDALVRRDKMMTVGTVHANASEFLAGRSWQGLEQQLGQTPVAKAVEGRLGIAASYSGESTG